MVFSSLIFLFLFLPVTLALYFAIDNLTYRNWVLIISSLIFYAWGEPVWVSLLILSTLFDYAHALIAERYRGRWPAKAALISAATVNLGVLGFFKYWGFLAGNLRWLGIHLPGWEFHLPIGISFYTFQTLSYVIDVYRGDVPAQRSYPRLLLFVSLFPQLVAGPIIRYPDIAREIEQRTHTAALFSAGINRLVLGLAKKVLLANTAGEVAEVLLSDPGRSTVLGAWLGIVMYAFQIYFDFSGYSDMAIGMGKMFGFTYKENFDYPYMARTATEFWRRWHISLGSFFRDYVYIPLGGNRRFPIRNLLVVWALTGLWHGASWNFVLWGMFWGLLIVAEKLVLLKLLRRLPALCSHLYLLTAVLVGWVLFWYTDLRQALQLLAVMFGFAGRPLADAAAVIYLMNNVFFLVVAALASTPLFSVLVRALAGALAARGWQPAFTHWVVPVTNLALLLMATALLVGRSYNPFLYFRF